MDKRKFHLMKILMLGYTDIDATLSFTPFILYSVCVCVCVCVCVFRVFFSFFFWDHFPSRCTLCVSYYACSALWVAQFRRFTNLHYYFVVVDRLELIIFVFHDTFKREGLCIWNYEAELYLWLDDFFPSLIIIPSRFTERWIPSLCLELVYMDAGQQGPLILS